MKEVLTLMINSNNTYITHINELDLDSLKLIKAKDNQGQPVIKIVDSNRKRLYVRTSMMYCGLGVSDGKMELFISSRDYEAIHKFDQWLEHRLSTCSDYLINTDHARESNMGESESIYRSVIKQCETGEEVLRLYLNPRTRIFDRNKQSIDKENYTEILNARFSCYALIELSIVQEYADKLSLSPTLNQLMILSFTQLPPGCLMFYDENEYLDALKERSNSTKVIGITEYDEEEDAVIDCDQDLNELLD